MRFPLPAFALLACALLPERLVATEVPDFNRDIRPILSNNCFHCHGPDEESRKGGQDGLRLDTSEGARTDLGGGAFAIVPGHPEKSELIARLITQEADELMPPPASGKTLTPAEIDLLRRWIKAGAPYARHWSYEVPQRPALPAVANGAWPQGPLDRFILARLEQERLRPQPEADRLTLARRVALDLTGLPPTLAEVEAFAADAAPGAYERFVDRQFAKPAYGEHWARLWLDLARYADSKGYADDQPRSIWAYRDYVIRAFSRDLPFDQFTLEQMAGDLLPQPTRDQIVATGFHRNTMNNTEGGTDDEEFRTVAVVDRVNTTLAVWMGTSMACAQCHTHKYDPITHKEYFQVYALLNQTEDADRNDETPLLEFFTAEQEAARERASAELAALHATFRAARERETVAAGEWARAFPARLDWRPAPLRAARAAGKTPVRLEAGEAAVEAGPAKETFTLEPTLPEGETLTALRLEAGPAANGGGLTLQSVRAGVLPPEPFRHARFVRVENPGRGKILSFAELEVFSGGQNVARTGQARQSSTAEGAEAARALDGNTDGDILFKSVTLTTTEDNPWWELDLGATLPLEKVVLWGRRGEEGTPTGIRITVLDAERRPVFERVTKEFPRPTNTVLLSDPRELPLVLAAADPGQEALEPGALVSDQPPRKAAKARKAAGKPAWRPGTAGGAGLTLVPARPLRLAPGEQLVLTVEQQGAKARTAAGGLRVLATTDARAGEHARTPSTVLTALRRQEAERTPAQRDSVLDHYVREVAPGLATERRRLAALQRELDEMPLQTTPILRELPAAERRATRVHLRGNFQTLGDEVPPGVPAVFGALPAGQPADRVALARWLVSRENPLTARVLANRLWEAIFGLGLVRTSEEFGAQGELPSHPELLDWLAVELMDDGWSVQRFLRRLVLSAAYRQHSRVTPEAFAADAENRLLSRGPRVRLAAEMVRDQALAVSGLLSAKQFGPAVRPYQPAFDLRAAFGGALDWKTSTGEDRLRRGLYTEWRRSSPYPSMVTFDAPNREVCTLRRPRTNTPLQALVTLNDPVYVEAAQGLARLMAHGGDSVAEKAAAGFRRVLLRAPVPAELAPLVALHAEALAGFTREPEQAAQLIANPDLPPPATFSAPDLAAWTAVANVLLNLDETLMKP
jgi:hypothetical protein